MSSQGGDGSFANFLIWLIFCAVLGFAVSHFWTKMDKLTNRVDELQRRVLILEREVKQ